MTKKEHIKWHRLGGMVLKPLFKSLGYFTQLEVDLSLKQQLLDILVVRREKIPPSDSGLPKIYWEAFENLNEYNLISFKSFRESFNGEALEEFFGHLTNYRKVNDVAREKINLYAITHHYPRDLLKPFEGTDSLKVIKEGEILDLKWSTMKQVRFVILRTTDNPLLALFSNNPPKIEASYQKLIEETELLEEISIYFSKIAEYYGEEINNMYTEQDFWRDYPPNKNPFVFPWLQEKYEREVEKIQATAREALRAKEVAAREALQAKEAATREAFKAKEVATREALRAKEVAAKEAFKAKEAAEKAAQQAAEKAKMESRMETANALLAMGMDLSIISKATNLSEQQILALKAADLDANTSSETV